jgi:hypothetical protein
MIFGLLLVMELSLARLRLEPKFLELLGLKSLIFEALGLEKINPKVARLSSAQLRLDSCWLVPSLK